MLKSPLTSVLKVYPENCLKALQSSCCCTDFCSLPMYAFQWRDENDGSKNEKICTGGHCTQGLIEILGSMVIFDEDKVVSHFNKYEFLYPTHVKIIKFLVISCHFKNSCVKRWSENPSKSIENSLWTRQFHCFWNYGLQTLNGYERLIVITFYVYYL